MLNYITVHSFYIEALYCYKCKDVGFFFNLYKYLFRNGALFTELRNLDIKLLKELSVSYICDLMVENKKVKYGLK